MISEVKFSHRFTSFWNGLFPHTSNFMRLVNSGVERIDIPIDDVEHSRKFKISVINQIGFKLFEHYKDNRTINNKLILSNLIKKEDKIIFDKIKEDAINYINRFERNDIYKNLNLDWNDLDDILEIATRLILKYNNYICELNPMFPGCGFLNQCYGDILLKKLDNLKIVEIKSGERNFTINDIRQILIYVGLDYIHYRTQRISEFELYNPRKGTCYSSSITELCWDLGNIRPIEFFEELEFYITETIFLSLELNNSSIKV